MARDPMSVLPSGFFQTKLDVWKLISLLSLILAGLIFFFYNAFRFEMPLGFSGMYTLMAEQISGNHYILPEIVPFYGPGGVPFAYPPLGFYIMALVRDLFDVSSITYLRFIPPLFSFLSLIPLFLLVERMTSSYWAAFFSTAFLLFSPTLYYNHTWSAGMVRGLAFLLMICGFYFFYYAIESERLFFKILAGIFLGLTGLSHLFYGLFFALWVGCWGLVGLNRKTWNVMLVTFLTGGLVGAPWMLLMIARYGAGIFGYAFSSHDNSAFIDVFQQGFGAMMAWFSGKFSSVPIPLIAFIASGFAIIYLLYKRQFALPAITLAMAVFLSPEGDRFMVLMVSILLGVSLVAAKEWLGTKWLQGIWVAFILASIFQMAGYGVRDVMGSAPVLYRNAYDVAGFIDENVPSDARYLFIAGQAEAEWFPYVLKRKPFVSKWGSEWLGTYDEQRVLQGRVAYCKDGQTLQCLKDLELDVSVGDVIITKKNQKDLSFELEASVSCTRMAVIGIYVVWSADCLIQ